MKIWTITNSKACIGKTTTAISIAANLAIRDRKTLLIDLDPAATISRYFGHDVASLEQGIFSLFNKANSNEAAPVDLSPLIFSTRFPHLSLLPASPNVSDPDGLKHDALSESRLPVEVTDLLKNGLRSCQDEFDHVIIDCPLDLQIPLINALMISDQLLMPVQTEFLAFKDLEKCKHQLKKLKHSYQLSYEELIIPTMFNRDNPGSIDSLQFLQQNHLDSLWEQLIPDDRNFRQASMIGLPLPLMEPNSKGALAYDGLVAQLLEAELEAAY